MVPERGARLPVLVRDQLGLCYYCATEMDPPPPNGAPCHPRAATIEHRLPKCRGGRSVRSNLAAVCASCNAQKGPMTEEEFWRCYVESFEHTLPGARHAKLVWLAKKNRNRLCAEMNRLKGHQNRKVRRGPHRIIIPPDFLRIRYQHGR